MASRIVYGSDIIGRLVQKNVDKGQQKYAIFSCEYKVPGRNSYSRELFRGVDHDLAARMFSFCVSVAAGADPRDTFKGIWPETGPGETVEAGVPTDGQTEGGQGEGLVAGSGDALLGVDGEGGERGEERGGDEFQPASPSNAVSIDPYFIPIDPYFIP